ncbi:MAG: Type-4 uracil-DNA glycosylase [Calditrichaeota bacterium]|nr:Type-4 uracil-DNA glycosylase [Calditrichota bacterium]
MSNDTRSELERVQERIRACTACRLAASRTHANPGAGGTDSRLMIVGEAPGRIEDETGLPFQGRSGAVLDETLREHGLARGRFFITASVKCRPPRNRTPRADELRTCRELWLERQIELIDPAVIVLLGQTAVKQVLGRSQRMSELHGRALRWRGRIALPGYHPAAALRFPGVRARFREDIGLLRALLERERLL